MCNNIFQIISTWAVAGRDISGKPTEECLGIISLSRKSYGDLRT